ncbi:MAG: hypothetical protein NVV82_16215 [Sporocytophaga sp.]|nr:hypothetical protein [Sporocytophaga sp.]
MKHNPRYILKHLSVRVPWHDRGWDGSICNNPKANDGSIRGAISVKEIDEIIQKVFER